MEKINDLLAKIGLSMRSALMIVGAAVAAWFLLGNRKAVTRRARRAVSKVTRRTSPMRRRKAAPRRRYAMRARGRYMRK
jgi:hypothetical protein